MNKISYNISNEGSLGLLALGSVGIRAWREKRKELDCVKKTGKANNED